MRKKRGNKQLRSLKSRESGERLAVELQAHVEGGKVQGVS
jgi:hypothetical protein